MTGRPSRKAFFGFDFKQLVNLKDDESLDKSFLRFYAYNSFVFPACEQCNYEHSDLESKAKAVVTKMLNYAPPAFHFGATGQLEKDLRAGVSKSTLAR